MDDALWAFARVSGLVDMVLLTGSVLLGILTRSGRPLPALPRVSLMLLHRNISLLAVVFLVFHVAPLLLDAYARVNLVDVVVPFLGSYKAFWQGLGTVALDLMAAVVATGLLRHRLGRRTFRAVHWLSYAMWPLALAHSVGNGTDATSAPAVAAAVVLCVAVLAAAAWRVSAGFLETADARRGGARRDWGRP
ncbi:ferric reductase-like transmembrane domain-containing protein [Arthrobacter wenxiniae]|jgi:sulfoxide reductase heme-binding subunit YedZ|uniref:Iron reductase n=1 Tax=Arthrobacter wenxiniae TaxID=2713570 RepID=A0A7Y7IE15_9MICC|nr:ferric reductase-like transmembrane domain-containing protein [Arthrobacter wenxiniae]NVM93779.1 iron reductase [Arthrobacter wenxiniae]